jgi:hypothetical protein
MAKIIMKTKNKNITMYSLSMLDHSPRPWICTAEKTLTNLGHNRFHLNALIGFRAVKNTAHKIIIPYIFQFVKKFFHFF